MTHVDAWRESIHPNRTAATIVVVTILGIASTLLWPSIYSLATWPGL
jgi:uncharacterized membrane protein YadS